MSEKSEGLSLKIGKKRSHGLETPFHRDQVVSTVAYLTSTIGQFLITYAFVLESGKLFVFVLTALLTSIVVFTWYMAASIDPEMKEHEPLPTTNSLLCCSSTSFTAARSTRYCLDCKKIVYEFDHHCSFLNNCVGGKNYAYFFVLITAAFLQMLLHIVTGIMVQSHCFDLATIQQYMNLWVFYTVVQLEILVSGVFSLLLCCLYGFHMYLYFVVKLGTYDWMMSRRKQRYEANSPSNGSNQSTHASRYHQVNSASPHPPREQESSISVNSTSIENVRRQLQREAYERQMRQNQLTRQHSQPKLPQRAGSNSSINQEEIQAPERSFRRGDLGNSSMDAGDVAMTSSRRSSTSVHTTSNSNQHNHHNHNVAPLDLKVIPPKLKLSGTDLLKGLLAKQSPRVSIYPQTVDFYDMERCITDDAESLNYELDQFYVQYQQEELEQQRYQPPVEEEEEEEEHDSSRSVATTKYS